METLLKTLSEFTAIPTIALLGVIIWQLVKNKRDVNAMTTNHLSNLPEIEQSQIRIEQKLEKMGDTLIEIKTLLTK